VDFDPFLPVFWFPKSRNNETGGNFAIKKQEMDKLNGVPKF